MKNKKQIEDVLKENGMFVSTTVGVSMYPMLRNRMDTIIITPCEGRLKKYDVPLYKKDSRYILHRIVEVRPDSYVTRGDNCYQNEYGITDAQILGVLTGFYRGTKRWNMDGWKYKSYVRLWCALFPLRRLYSCTRKKAALLWRRMKKGADKS